jgi:D-3-phosphoglycerate dehydrogenase
MCLLNAETTHAFDERASSLMKPGCIIANLPAAPSIDERAMCEALRSGRIMAALDTFEEEPLPPESPAPVR